MTLNGVMALILRYFTELGSFRAHCVRVVEDVVKKFTFAISSPGEFIVSIDMTGRPFVKRFALCYRTLVLILATHHSVCGQNVGWIKIPLGTEVGLGPGHIVLDGDPQGKRHSSPHLWPNGWMDQDTTCYGGRPRPR